LGTLGNPGIVTASADQIERHGGQIHASDGTRVNFTLPRAHQPMG
jgi:hypothetical protein